MQSHAYPEYWTYTSNGLGSQTYNGEDEYVIMFSLFHIGMAMWTAYGYYLKASGWTTALSQAGIASFETADSILKQPTSPGPDWPSSDYSGVGQAGEECVPRCIMNVGHMNSTKRHAEKT